MDKFGNGNGNGNGNANTNGTNGYATANGYDGGKFSAAACLVIKNV